MPDLAAQGRLRQTLALLVGIALLGALAAFTPMASWAALALYLLGSLALLAWRALGMKEAEALFLRGPGLRASLLWGAVLFHMLLIGAMLGSLR